MIVLEMFARGQVIRAPIRHCVACRREFTVCGRRPHEILHRFYAVVGIIFALGSLYLLGALGTSKCETMPVQIPIIVRRF